MGLYNLVEKDGAEEAVWGTRGSAGNRGEHQAHLVSGETPLLTLVDRQRQGGAGQALRWGAGTRGAARMTGTHRKRAPGEPEGKDAASRLDSGLKGQSERIWSRTRAA